MNFYGSDLGDRLINENFFPIEIKNFLKEEENIIGIIKPSFNCLVEVGCMNGRYLQWAIENHRNYIGIDIIPSYIKTGRQRIKKLCGKSSKYSFILGNAENIDTLLSSRISVSNKEKSLLLFPFNSFGNMQDFTQVIRSIKKSRLQFFISTYSTASFNTLCRRRYYESCSYLDLIEKEDDKGVTFISKDGLCTIAYHSKFLLEVFKRESINVDVINFKGIGIAYTSHNLINY